MRYIAFLRAINVGGHVVKMDRLRRLFEELPLTNVETFIASGNVIFDSPSTDAAALEKRIEKHLEKALGYEVGTCVRSCAEVAAVAAYSPFDGAKASGGRSNLYVVFLKTAADKTMRARLDELCTGIDAFHAHKRELYWLTFSSISQSPAAVAFGKAFGKMGTMRNITTVRKLASKYAR